MKGSTTQLGQFLVEKGLLQLEELMWALEVQARTKERLGKILLTYGLLRRRELYWALGQLWNMPFVLLTQEKIDRELLEGWPLEQALQHRALPLRRDGEAILVATTEKPDRALEESLERHLDGPFRFAVTTEWDIDWAIRLHYNQPLLEQATHALYYRSPAESAYTVFTPPQYLALGAGVLALLVGLYWAPVPTLVGLNLLFSLFFFTSILFKFIASLAGAASETWQPVRAEEIRALDDRELPYYTILVPVYREANVVGLLMENLARLDYPKEKLEILVLVEEDDPETLEAAKRAKPPETVQFVVIPHGIPKTKPKACNVGLYFARGEYLVIYDAEDQPEPDQLKKAVVAFRKGPEHLVCVQAALNYFNWEENFLTRMFTLEYSHWFDYMLPGLYRLGLPIPLGGTSNHFKTDKLRELGGWDPFNVTEDADLGIRAAMRGYTVGIINSTTYEEANNRFWNFIRQRSRWIKGYMQTVLVHSRHPLRILRRVGLKQFLGFFLPLGGTPLTFLLSPILWVFFFFWLFTGTKALDAYFPPLVLYLSLLNLLWGNGLAIYLSLLAGFKRGLYALSPYALLNPVYWLLHSAAAYMALYELFTRPFYWQKTLHGLSQELKKEPRLTPE